MKRILITLFLLISFTCLWGQTREDYIIYTTIIKNWQSKIGGEVIPESVITDRLSKIYLEKDLFKDLADDPLAVLRTIKINKETSDSLYLRLKDQDFAGLASKFGKEYAATINLESEKFDQLFNVTIVKSKYIDKLLAKAKAESWSKFYEKYPDSNGLFQFSKISYKDNFALVYFVSARNPLMARGEIIVMKRVQSKWNILGNFILWQA